MFDSVPRLFASECDHRIDARGPPRRKIAGERRQRDEAERGPREGARIERRDAEEQILQIARARGGCGKTDADADARSA